LICNSLGYIGTDIVIGVLTGGASKAVALEKISTLNLISHVAIAGAKAEKPLAIGSKEVLRLGFEGSAEKAAKDTAAKTAKEAAEKAAKEKAEQKAKEDFEKAAQQSEKKSSQESTKKAKLEPHPDSRYQVIRDALNEGKIPSDPYISFAKSDGNRIAAKITGVDNATGKVTVQLVDGSTNVLEGEALMTIRQSGTAKAGFQSASQASKIGKDAWDEAKIGIPFEQRPSSVLKGVKLLNNRGKPVISSEKARELLETILGTPDLKTGYKKLLMKLHPDRTTQLNSSTRDALEEEFKLIKTLKEIAEVK
jgi:hypothetical protein